MAFLFETIPEEDKQQVDFSKFKVEGRGVDTHWWSVDRNEDAFLVYSFQEREPPYEEWYAFYWKGKLFKVVIIDEKRHQLPNEKWNVVVKISGIVLPHGVHAKTQEANEAVKRIEESVKEYIRGRTTRAGWGKDILEIKIER